MKNTIVYYSVKKVPKNFNGENTLPENILKHINNSRKENALESIYAWETLKNLSNFNLKDVEFLQTGKPILKNCSISLSHSKGYVAIAFTSSLTELGIDVEKIQDKSLKFLTKISTKFNSLDTKSQYELWTKHESTVKALNLKLLKDTKEEFFGISKIINTLDGEFSLSIYNKGTILNYEDKN